jgi:AAA domain
VTKPDWAVGEPVSLGSPRVVDVAPLTPDENRVLDIKTLQRDRAETSSGYRFKTFDEMAVESVAKRWLIKNIFARGETSAWIAPPGGMKSALMAQASICVAAGLDWHGHRSKETAAVLYFAIERADLVRRRLRAHGIRLDLKGLPVAVVSSTIDLTHPEAYKKVVDTVREAKAYFGLDVGLVIIDTFAKLIAAAGGDENSARDQGAVFANVQRVKNATDVHVALVGHTGKDESRGARGSNALLGDVDVMVTLSGGDIRTATVTKANDAPEGPLFSFKSEVHEFERDEDGDPVTVNVVSSEEQSVQAARRGSDRWPKGLKLVHEAIRAAMLESGLDHRVGGDGPTVKAIIVQTARAIHKQRYVSSGDGDRNESERKAWARNFKIARETGRISGELKEGQECSATIKMGIPRQSG